MAVAALFNRDLLRKLLPAITLAILLAAVFTKQPVAMSQFGLTPDLPNTPCRSRWRPSRRCS